MLMPAKKSVSFFLGNCKFVCFLPILCRKAFRHLRQVDKPVQVVLEVTHDRMQDHHE